MLSQERRAEEKPKLGLVETAARTEPPPQPGMQEMRPEADLWADREGDT